MSNTDNSGSARSARVRRISAAKGPIPFIRPNIGSQSLDAKLGKNECCIQPRLSPVLTQFAFTNFNSRYGTTLAPCDVAFNNPNYVDLPNITITLEISGVITYPFQFNTYTSNNFGTQYVYPSGLTISPVITNPYNPFSLYVDMPSSVATVTNPFVSTGATNIYTYTFSVSIPLYFVTLANPVASMTIDINSTSIPSTFLLSDGILSNPNPTTVVITYPWGVLTSTDTLFYDIFAGTPTTVISVLDLVSTGGNNYIYTYKYYQTAQFVSFQDVLQNAYYSYIISSLGLYSYPIVIGNNSTSPLTVPGLGLTLDPYNAVIIPPINPNILDAATNMVAVVYSI